MVAHTPRDVTIEIYFFQRNLLFTLFHPYAYSSPIGDSIFLAHPITLSFTFISFSPRDVLHFPSQGMCDKLFINPVYFGVTSTSETLHARNSSVAHKRFCSFLPSGPTLRDVTNFSKLQFFHCIFVPDACFTRHFGPTSEPQFYWGTSETLYFYRSPGLSTQMFHCWVPFYSLFYVMAHHFWSHMEPQFFPICFPLFSSPCCHHVPNFSSHR